MTSCPHKSVVDDFLYPNICLECRSEKGRRHYAKHKEKVLAKAAEYRKKNPERVKEFKRKYYEKLKNVTLIKESARTLTREERFYVNKLKNIIYTINEIERRYRKYSGIA